jgi:hypothetical protein
VSACHPHNPVLMPMGRDGATAPTWIGRAAPPPVLSQDLADPPTLREHTLIIRQSPGRERNMEVPLSPLEFMRRSRRLYADREAVVDGDLRLT